MPTSLQEFTTEALALPVEARAFLVEKLLESLDEHEDFPISEAWMKEITKRSREIDEGRVQGIPAEQVFDEMRRELE